MAKKTKVLSVLLAFLLTLSCFSAGLVAFAQTESSAKGNTAAPESTVAADEEAPDSEEDSITEMLNGYAELAEKKEVLSAEQRAKLDTLGQMIFSFGSNVADTVTSKEAVEQYKSILESVSGIAIKAFSAKSGPVGKVESMINAYSGKMSVESPTEEDLNGYNELVAAYNNLTDAQKEEVDLLMFDKLFHLVLDREYQLAKAANPKPNAKVDYAAAQKAAEALLGADFFDEVQALFTVIDTASYTASQKLEAFAAASEKLRLYAGVWYKNYTAAYYKLDSSSMGSSFVKIVQAFEKEYLAAEPFTEVAPAKVSRPSDKNYPNGANDPDYIRDFEVYMQNQKDIAEYNCRKANYTANFDIQGMEKVASVAAEYQPAVSLMKNMLAAANAFDADKTQTAGAKAALKEYENLSAIMQLFIQKNTTIRLRSIPKGYAASWSTTAQSANALYTYCTDIGSYDNVTAFIALLEEINQPYTNQDILRAKEAYVLIPSNLHSSIPADIAQKYKDILASISPDAPSYALPDLTVYGRTVVTYPENVSREQVEKALPRIQTLLTDVLLPVAGVDGGLPQMVKTGLYTNATVAELCKFLFPLLYSLRNIDGFPSMAAAFVKIEPSKLYEALPEEKFAGAVNALKNAEATGQANYDAALANGAKEEDLDIIDYLWNTLTFADGDWGFQDGDKEGFLDAVSAVFRAVSIITMLITLENEKSTTNGTYTYGAYEDLVPIFEGLDTEGYLSSTEYAEQVRAAKAYDSENSTKTAMDARVRPILVPIFNLIDTFAQAPLDTLLDVLPKLGYALESNLLNDQISALISKLGFGLGESISLDLSTEGLFNLVAPMLESLTIGETTLSIKLDRDNFVQFINDIGGCGTAVSKDSVARGTAYRLGIDSDKPDAFVVLFRWLFTEITEPENINSIKAVVESSDLGFLPKLLIKLVISSIAEKTADEALTSIVKLVAPSIPSIEDIISNLKPGDEDADKDNDNDSNNNNDGNTSDNGTEQKDNPSIPKTGGKIAITVFAIAATAGLAGGTVLLKKKKD